jgi:hypothetical protein
MPPARDAAGREPQCAVAQHIKTVARKTDSKAALDRELAHTRAMMPSRLGVLGGVHQKCDKLVTAARWPSG